MRPLTLLGSVLAGSCLVIAAMASAEPVTSNSTTTKHPECQGTKVKTSCEQQAVVTDFVKGRQAQSEPAPKGAHHANASKSGNASHAAKEKSADEQQPK